MRAKKTKPATVRGRPRKNQGQQLSLDRIIDTALRIIDQEGLAALSMRRLGVKLNVDPMAIYHYVPSKEVLLRALVRAVFSRMNVTVVAVTPWRERVEVWARSYLDLFWRYPTLLLHITSDADLATAAMGSVCDPLYIALRDAGLSESRVTATADTLVDFLNGHGLGLAGWASHTPLHHGIGGTFTIGLRIIVEGAVSLSAESLNSC